MDEAIGAGGVDRLQVGRGPHGEAVIAVAARCAIANSRVAHPDAEVDAVGDGVAEAAAFDQKPVGIDNPRARLGVFDPDVADDRTGAERTDDAVVWLGVIAVVQLAVDGEVSERDVRAVAVDRDAVVGCVVVNADQRRIPDAGAADGNVPYFDRPFYDERARRNPPPAGNVGRSAEHQPARSR